MQQHRVSEKGPAAFSRVLSISQERASPMPQKFRRSRAPRKGNWLPARPHPARRNQTAGAAASHPARRNQTAGTAALQQACMPPARFFNPPREQSLRPAIPAFLKSWKLLAMVQPFSYFSIREPLRPFASVPGRLSVSDFPETVGYTRLSPGIPGGFSAGRSRFPSPILHFFSPIPRVPAGSSYPLTTNIGGILTQNLI